MNSIYVLSLFYHIFLTNTQNTKYITKIKNKITKHFFIYHVYLIHGIKHLI